jgi:hypothetical protein
MFFDSEVEIYYDLLKNDQILTQCISQVNSTSPICFHLNRAVKMAIATASSHSHPKSLKVSYLDQDIFKFYLVTQSL